MAKSDYTEDNIKTLEWVPHIRKRPGMYIGEIGDGNGYHDCVYVLLKEVIDNGVDEFMRGFGKTIEVNVNYETNIGGMIQNKEYRLAPPKSKILLLQEGCPERIYVKFKPAKNQRVHQAYFDTNELAVRSASARGLQLTTKSVARISATKPGWWNDAEGSGKGSLF